MKTFNKAELLALYPNMSVWQTGGGCTALGMNLDDDGHILITDDGSVPDDGALHVCAGRYDKHGEWDELRAPYGGMDIPVHLLERWIDRQVSEALNQGRGRGSPGQETESQRIDYAVRAAWLHTSGGKEEQIANARLIAAAPDLLAALIEMEHKFDADPSSLTGAQSRALTNARHVIAKAGEQS